MFAARSALSLCLALAALPAAAQIGFDASRQDTGVPIEVTAESLRMDQEANTAVFTGDVVILQDSMRMTAEEVTVVYSAGQDDIESIVATGGVTLVTPREAAEGERAVYRPIDQHIVITGDVLLTRGAGSIAGDRLDYDLEAGKGTVSGGVRTILGGGN